MNYVKRRHPSLSVLKGSRKKTALSATAVSDGTSSIRINVDTRVGTLIVATINLQLIQKSRYMFRSFTVLQCNHQHCVQPVASDVEVVEYL